MIDITNIQIKPSPIFAFAKVAPLILLSFIVLFLAALYLASLSFLAIVIIVVAAYKYAYVRSILYTITAERLIIKTGIFMKRTDQLEFYRVKDYIVTEPFLMQIFSLMNLTLVTTDNINKNITLTGIPKSNIADTIRNFVQEARLNNRIFEVN